MLEFHRVTMRFKDGTEALNDVSLTIPKGQICVILGPSGAGKSTLLRAVNGLTPPTSGEVRIDGQAVTPRNLRTLRPRIGMVHQGFNLVARASVAQNVIAGALPHTSTFKALCGFFDADHQRKACHLLSEVGLGAEHLRRRADALSGGQQQRVGIARAFMLDPAIILADEPVASLDPKTSEDILRLIVTQARSHEATVLCTLHQVDLARQFAERIIALKAGRIVFDGPPEALSEAALGEIYDQTPQARATA